MSVVERTKELLRVLALQREWMRLAGLYIAWLETEASLRRGSHG